MIIDELFEAPQPCPECGGISFSDLILAEKKDACYYKVKASAKVWPSAYASGRLVQCRKKGAANYGNKSESVAEGSLAEMDKSAPQPGRDGRVSHSTYGSRDKGGSKGPEKEARPITAKKAKQDAFDILKKQGVAEEQELDEKWSQKYKSSINCANPKGFSQPAHCAGRKKNESIEENRPKEKEADYGADYQAMVARVKHLAGLGPLKTVWDPQKRVYKNVPVAVQPKK